MSEIEHDEHFGKGGSYEIDPVTGAKKLIDRTHRPQDVDLPDALEPATTDNQKSEKPETEKSGKKSKE